MMLPRWPTLSIVVILIILSALHALASTSPRLGKPPLGDRWFTILFNDEPAGFFRSETRETVDGYEMSGISCTKMSGFGFSRDATIREDYVLNRDMTLRSFAVEGTIEGKAVKASGKVSAAGIRVIPEIDGSGKERLLKHKGAVYSPLVLNMYPQLRGAELKKTYTVSMLDVEELKIRKVKISVVGYDDTATGRALHIRNNLYPVANDIWMDAAGNTLKESVRDGWIVTLAEDSRKVRQFIAEAALARKDFIFAYSRITADKPIAAPARLVKMTLELPGYPATAPLATSLVQKMERLPEGRVLVTVDNSILRTTPQAAALSREEQDRYLGKTAVSHPVDTTLAGKAAEIIGTEKNSRNIVEKLVRWIAQKVEETDSADQSPLETLHKGKGNNLSRIRLYVALAHAAGIPTKPVAGLVYDKDRDFLYQSWAESYVGYWLPVDPALGEAPANATHLKLVEGDTPENMQTLADMIGNLRMKLLEERYPAAVNDREVPAR